MADSLRLMPLCLLRLREAVEAEQIEPVQREAHTLKGSCRTIGDEAVGNASSDMEQAAKRSDMAEAASRLAQAEQKWTRLRDALEDALAQDRWEAA
jgi:HPt (histidine-containing phosphotransfer) domain-containing protein